MTVVNFTPVTGLVGGLLIGAAAVITLLFGGRIAGVSGILGGALSGGQAGDRAWRWIFLAGLFASGLLYQMRVPGGLVLDSVPGTPLLVIAGLLVGIGTRLGNGCTSGHGVCGMALSSKRSFVATLSFMAAGAATVFVTRHLV